MNLMLSVMIPLSITFMMMNTPISMGGIVVISTMNIALIMGCELNTFLFSYLLVILMLSGMMVIFMYMAVIASNNMFYPSIKIMLSFIFMAFITYMVMEKMKSNYSINEFNMTINLSINLMMTLTAIVMLLMTMVVVVMILSTNSGPLRMSNN
uniref:NADH dehydrogenase subunit 6 n=1 Tax=Mezira sp. TaxID=2931906 RepID=A0A8T9VZJ7_9HEMI|nr:NADH dehydrogenase subunit 6 [Mezira sp.]